MSSRIKSDIKTTADSVAIVAADISYFNATGTIGEGSTDMKITVSGTQPGKLRVTLPSDNRYLKTLAFSMDMEASGTQHGAYSVLKSGHSTVSGTYDFTIVSGSAVNVAVEPAFTSKLSFTLYARDTNRRT